MQEGDMAMDVAIPLRILDGLSGGQGGYELVSSPLFATSEIYS